MEHLQAALKAANNFSRPGEQIFTILRQLCYGGYLIYDAAAWVSCHSINGTGILLIPCTGKLCQIHQSVKRD